MINKTVKKVFIALGSLLFLLLLAGNLLSYFSNDNKDLIEKSKKLLKENTTLVEKVDQLQKDKLQLLEDLNKKEVQIVYKEKIIYKDGQLIIPQDYDELKVNYVTLSGIYQDRSIMYFTLKAQSETDYKTIDELKTKLKEVNDMNKQLTYSLEHPTKTVFKHYIIGGFKYSVNNQLSYLAGYQLIFIDAFSLQAIVQYPDPSISILLGIKING